MSPLLLLLLPLKVVPQDFNIFTLLGIPVPAGGPEGWRIVMKNDSVAYAKVATIFKVSESRDLVLKRL